MAFYARIILGEYRVGSETSRKDKHETQPQLWRGPPADPGFDTSKLREESVENLKRQIAMLTAANRRLQSEAKRNSRIEYTKPQPLHSERPAFETRVNPPTWAHISIPIPLGPTEC